MVEMLLYPPRCDYNEYICSSSIQYIATCKSCEQKISITVLESQLVIIFCGLVLHALIHEYAHTCMLYVARGLYYTVMPNIGDDRQFIANNRKGVDFTKRGLIFFNKTNVLLRMTSLLKCRLGH